MLKEAHDITNEPVLPRKRKIPKQINDGAQCYQQEIPKDYYRQKYYEVYDIVSNEISRRFDQRDFTIIAECEKLLLNAANNFDFTIPEPVHTTYKDDLHIDQFSVQLKMLPVIIKRHGEITGIPIKKVTNIHTIYYCMNDTPSVKYLCSELYHLLQIFLTIPATTSTSERTFSAMKRLKNYLRSSMT